MRKNEWCELRKNRSNGDIFHDQHMNDIATTIMTTPILSFTRFLGTAPGQLLSQWELEHFQKETEEAFGYEALQLGLPELDTLCTNRIQRHWSIIDENDLLQPSDHKRVPVMADHRALPFACDTFDLITMPHTLDLTREPQQVLREAVRVLTPEGRLVITGFNTLGCWWWRQKAIALGAKPFLPSPLSPIALMRLKDWFGLLGLQIDRSYWGLYRPACHSIKSLQHWQWMDKAGDRWMPGMANLYMLSAVKRQPGPKLVGRLRSLMSSPSLGTNVANLGSQKTPSES